jgi:hypothetical protein
VRVVVVDVQGVPDVVVEVKAFASDPGTGEFGVPKPDVTFAVESSSVVDSEDSDGDGFGGDGSESVVADATP